MAENVICAHCGGTCAQGCTGQALETCGGDCSGVCKNTCTETCSFGCGDSCLENCSDSCLSDCGNVCESGCAYTCKGQCTSCTGSCTGTCKTTCVGTCNDGCAGSCKDSCAGCSGSCTGGCTGCSGSCSGDCTGTCLTTCSHGCSDKCTGCNGCTGCSGSCSGSCENTCLNACTGGCETTCTTGCQGKCKGGCETSCDTRCEGSCSSECLGTCKIACGISCTGDCSGCTADCSANCTGDCTSSCMGTCTGSAHKRSPFMYVGTAENVVHFRKVPELIRIQDKTELNDDDQIIAVQRDETKRVDLELLMRRIVERISIPPMYYLHATVPTSAVNGIVKNTSRLMEATSSEIGRLTDGLPVNLIVDVPYKSFHNSSTPWSLKITFNDGTSQTDVLYMGDGEPATTQINNETQAMLLVYFENVTINGSDISGWFIPNIAHNHDDRYYTQAEIDEVIAELDTAMGSRPVITDDEVGSLFNRYTTYTGVIPNAAYGSTQLNIPNINIPNAVDTIGHEDTRSE